MILYMVFKKLINNLNNKEINLKMKIRLLIILISFFYIASCSGGKIPSADARKISPNPKDRVQKNLEEGRGFRLLGNNKKNSGEFDFASSNELWRASLDTLEFMPLALANYSGGIIVTDWYSDGGNNESVKISIRFLSNEIRSDAIDINVFYKKCDADYKCVVQKNNQNIEAELRREILKKAAIYQKQTKAKNKTFYPGVKMGKD